MTCGVWGEDNRRARNTDSVAANALYLETASKLTFKKPNLKTTQALFQTHGYLVLTAEALYNNQLTSLKTLDRALVNP